MSATIYQMRGLGLRDECLIGMCSSMKKSRFSTRIYWMVAPMLCGLAQTAWGGQCVSPVISSQAKPLDAPEQAIVLESDQLITQDRNVIDATGDVTVRTPTETVYANRAQYENSTGALTLTGDVKINRNGGVIESERVDYNIQSRTGDFANSAFTFPRQASHPNESSIIKGSATSVTQAENGVLHLNQATYTTCTQAKPDWAVHASKIKLDQNTGIGTAKHMRLHLGRVPVFYWPYINFPINDQRKTGFLFPNITSNTRNGITYNQPFYWNIRPNADATFTLAPSTKAGAGLLTQWRYLNKLGTYNLTLDGRDDKASDTYQDTRWFGQFTHQGVWQTGDEIQSQWASHINYKRVSDKDYLDDFDAPIANETHIASTFDTSYTLTSHYLLWHNVLGAQVHQTPDDSIADASKPYDKAPYFNNVLQSRNLPVSLTLNTQWAQFTHPSKADTQRLDSYRSLSYTLERSYGFITPKIAARHTQYKPSGQSDASRTLPIASVDSGLTFEKNYTQITHSISPRAYFLYVPFKDQSDLPNFDTSLSDFSYDNLFAENRFTGIDRQGDAKQVTLGLSNQWQNRNTGITRAKIDIARAFYDEPQRVGLTSTNNDNTLTHSDIALRSQFGLSAQVGLEATGQYNTEYDAFIDHRYTLRYQSNNNQLFAGYHQENTYSNGARTAEDTSIDAGGYWAVTPQWTLMGLGVYNIDDSREQELSLGIKYKDCCWGVSLVATHELDENTTNENDYTQSYYLQFSLDGLASVGQDSNDLTQRIQNR